ncbi:MAG TPA: SDR family oxidoreductase [Geminicoccus sp.]|jgi:NAD(P)-dependent dehydrogenase (short-subunit alcohol dehydrogenase family)|uniref:SDR family NAD(P)-dependent oxidoreductase n=1 Tax=Geminicoccus sp. TaxID=2024832 RepID=UPI002E33C572|nr:SDR family oxidoreductase [Geminicoccus sp.]HEX2526789.1 SDR family oxidoreductase [Geminicoccus sp.]
MTLAADLSGRTALVTGASGAIGAHAVALFLRSSANVVATARDPSRVKVRDDSRTLVTQLDVTDLASIDQAFEAAESRFGPVDLVLNNAGIADGQLALQTDPARFADILAVDLTGAFAVARAAAARMVAAKRPGSIINVASILGLRVAQGVAAYAAAKAGLVQLTAALGLEWARHDIRVNAIAPGYLLTDINRSFFESEAGARMIKRIPQRRLGELADLDGPLLLLASEASAYMTGSVLVVDGGHVASTL